MAEVQSNYVLISVNDIIISRPLGFISGSVTVPTPLWKVVKKAPWTFPIIFKRTSRGSTVRERGSCCLGALSSGFAFSHLTLAHITQDEQNPRKKQFSDLLRSLARLS